MKCTHFPVILMKEFIDSVRAICDNDIVKRTIKGIAMGMMLAAILMHLLDANFSTAPEFSYNQF